MVSKDNAEASKDFISATAERYSFSKLSSWWTCPYGYKFRYIDHKQGIGNAFSSYGTLVHSIMERYSKGEIKLKDMPSIFEWEFDTLVPEKFPYNKYVDLRDSYYKQGVNFLRNFNGYDDIKILGVEEEFEIKIDDWIFVGIIDLVFEDKDGRIIIRDYKSKASFKDDEEKRKYARQLYLYSIYVKEKYGKYPDELQFLMFRKHDEPVVVNFEEPSLNEAVRWAQNTVKIIREAFDYPPTCDQFYGENLCNHRKYCEFKEKPRWAKRKRGGKRS